ncbi:MAG TPA: hypothetical protein VGB52_07715 [Actinomycetota bacterium]
MDEVIEISAKVPRANVERMRVLAEAAGVTLEAFVCASFEARVEQHEGLDALNEDLTARARRYV